MMQLVDNEKTPPLGIVVPPKVEWTSRDELPFLLNKLGLTGVGVEVGVERANFTSHIRQNWDGKLLVAVDKWELNPNYPSFGNERHLQCYEQAKANIGSMTKPVEVIKMWSTDAAHHIEALSEDSQIKRLWNGGLDFVYLDADHSYAAVISDIEAWYPLVRSGGIICGHDFLEAPDGWFRQMDAKTSYPTFEAAGAADAWPCGVHRAVYEKFASSEVALTSPDTDAGFRSWAVVKP